MLERARADNSDEGFCQKDLTGSDPSSVELPGPPKEPKILALDHKVKNTGSIGSIVLGILEVQVLSVQETQSQTTRNSDAFSSSGASCWQVRRDLHQETTPTSAAHRR